MTEAEKDAEIARLKQLLERAIRPQPPAHPSELLENLARRTWHRIQDGRRWHIRQGETAISDYLLLEIARAGFPSIKIIKTSPTKETLQGTDWEWWVGSRRCGWIHYAMQAKRLCFPSDRYDALGHKVDLYNALGDKVDSCLQVDTLIKYAKDHDAIPLYCLYNATIEPPPERYWHCNLPFELEQLGCTVAPAEAVKAFLSKRGQRTFQAVHNDLGVPWRCLVGCPSILHSYLKGEVRLPFPAPNDVAIVHPTLPSNVEAAFEMVEAEALPINVEAAFETGNSDEQFFLGNHSYFPSYQAIIDIFETAREPPLGNDFYH
jgi:hypothetical protein